MATNTFKVSWSNSNQQCVLKLASMKHSCSLEVSTHQRDIKGIIVVFFELFFSPRTTSILQDKLQRHPIHDPLYTIKHANRQCCTYKSSTCEY